MSKPKNTRRIPRKGKSGTKTSNTATHGRRQRWFYDVRQYALVQDEEQNTLLLQLPSTYDEDAANSWTLPGGKLEPSDEPKPGILREIKEETGLNATLQSPCSVARWTTRNSKKLAIFYKATVEGVKPAPVLSAEHQRFAWVTPAEVKNFHFHREDMATVLEENL
ncbi:MAG: hypothetical protein COY40_01390 [Alphaproteobacteria bacterium CG_4_10_14_0_8_um_filter_53_9]|nr:MAG: hypothetical protein COY40_01390 [Alphaproteobacteria bacterium CG_4_10_14_0_8_um_filter_53_9]